MDALNFTVGRISSNKHLILGGLSSSTIPVFMLVSGPHRDQQLVNTTIVYRAFQELGQLLNIRDCPGIYWSLWKFAKIKDSVALKCASLGGGLDNSVRVNRKGCGEEAIRVFLVKGGRVSRKSQG